MSFQKIKLLVLFFIFFLLSCGSKALSPLSTSATILAFGDSLTVGHGTTQEFSYPTVLSELSGRTVINAGISGETTEQGLTRFQHELEKHSPDLVILIEGGNDILRNVSQSTSKQNLAKMITTAQELNIPLVLLGVPEKNLRQRRITPNWLKSINWFSINHCYQNYSKNRSSSPTLSI